MREEEVYQLALTFLNGIGPQRARLLVSHCGGVRNVFESTLREIALQCPVSTKHLRGMERQKALDRANDELHFMSRRGIRSLFYLDATYPQRLRHCDDAPLILYAEGNVDLNARKALSVVGTRRATEYGAQCIQVLMKDLVAHQPLIVSGLALGVDSLAHRAALQYQLPTVAVLGHSLEREYPAQNSRLYQRIRDNGMLLTEFVSGTKPDRENFPMRNRIVAGMCDACIVVETAVKGGSIITAKLASGYHRDVLAFPGMVGLASSSGCNMLIKTNQAALIERVEDLEYSLGWTRDSTPEAGVQKALFTELSAEEEPLVALLRERQPISADDISLHLRAPMSKVSSLLLQLEFKGVVRTLPGKHYSLC